jgi:hypothetical protein
VFKGGQFGSLAERLKAFAAPVATVKQDRPPTEEQQAIIDLAVQVLAAKGEGTRVLMIEAGAGTGKTTTLRMLADALQGTGQYTAFNTSLVAESKAKFFGTRVACNTTHSLAFRAVGKNYASRLEGHRIKADQLARMLHLEALSITVGEASKRLAPGWLASQVMGAIRRFCQSADRAVVADHFKYIDGIDVPHADGSRSYDNNERVREYLLIYAEKAWRDLSNPEGQLPFAHDHYVKLWQLDNPVIAADFILLDESQDTAPVMLDILAQQMQRSNPPMLILVGDSAQQIYEWRGAVNALAAFPGAPRRFLSQSFRFGAAIAAVANSILGKLTEPTPLRLKGLPSIPSTVAPVGTPTAILCRTNAVAVSNLLEAIATGKRPFLVGGGSDVVSFVEAAQSLQRACPTGHPELACFSSWSEVQEYAKQDEGEDLRLMVKLIDTFGCDDILQALRGMPKEADADLVISTAHKSKGREWSSVRLAADFPTADKCQDSDLKLLYVSVTRAKLQLDISECPWFTGVDVPAIVKSYDSGAGIIPPAPSTAPAITAFSWSRSPATGNWEARGPKGMAGKEVDIVRKDGSKQKKLLGVVTWENDIVATYRVR